jgi:hypothetical protein
MSVVDGQNHHADAHVPGLVSMLDSN